MIDAKPIALKVIREAFLMTLKADGEGRVNDFVFYGRFFVFILLVESLKSYNVSTVLIIL